MISQITRTCTINIEGHKDVIYTIQVRMLDRSRFLSSSSLNDGIPETHEYISLEAVIDKRTKELLRKLNSEGICVKNRYFLSHKIGFIDVKDEFEYQS